MKITIECSVKELKGFINKKEPQRETLIRHIKAIGQILQKEGTPHNLVIIDAYSYRITSDELGGSINEVVHSDKN